MAEEQALRNLFDRWEKVWHEGRYDLVAGCVAPVYIRHDELGTRTVTPDEYAAELRANRQARPDSYIAVYDHAFFGDRAWFRFTLMWSDSLMGEARTRAGMQLYRIEEGKLAETWVTLLGANSSWPDTAAQQRWTSKRAANQS